MSEPQTWVEALNIDPESLTHWSSQVPTGKPLLVHCLEQGLVDADAYLAWATERFGLPVLRANYFQENFDPALLAQAKQDGGWSPWIFPVSEWDGVRYIACTEPPAEPADNERYVLCDPRAMYAAWSPESEITAPPPVSETDWPQGMSEAPPSFVLDLENATFANTQVDVAPVEATSTEATAVEEDAATAEQIAPKVVPAAKAAQATVATSVAGETPVGATAMPVAEEEAVIQLLFAALGKVYSASVVLKCTDQTVSLYRWDKGVKPSADKNKTTINLSYPTFLRIVAKTNLPYHGYLVDSPAHRELFQALGFAELPKCVTVVPVRLADKLWGMVLAIGNEKNQKMDSLSLAQDQGEKLANALLTLGQTKAA